MKLQLTHRLMLVVALALLPISALQAWSIFKLERQQVSVTEGDALRLLALIEDQQAATIAGVRQVLAVVRQTKVIIERDWSGCQDLLSRMRDELPPYLSVYVTDERGINVCAAEPRAVGLDSSRREHVAAALAGKPFAIGSRIIARSSGKPALPLAAPIRDRTTGAVTGTVAALLDTGSLDALLAAKPLPAGATLTVADRTGTIIARSPDTAGLTGTLLPDSFQSLALQSSTGTRRMVDLDGTTRLIAFSPVDVGATDLFIALSLDQADTLVALRDTRSHALILLAAVAAGTALVVLWLGQRYVRIPAASLSDSARRWRAGELGARAEVQGSAVEFARLAEDFNAMADALDLRERALKSTSEQHRAVFDTAVDAIVVIDETGLIRSVNPATEKAFGYACGDLLGSNVRTLMGDEHRAFHNGYMQAYLETGIRRIIGIGRTVEGRRSDGTLFPLELSIAEWRDQAGRRFFTGIMRDISARAAAERQAEDERSRLRRIVDGAPFPAMVHAETGDILHISHAWLELTGYTRAELVRVSDWTERAYGTDVPEEALALSDIERLYQLDRPADEGEYVIRTASGARRTWAFRSAPIGPDAGGRRLVVTMAADVTERRDGEERIRLLMREVDHRAKNALMVVQSIVQLSRSEDPAEFSRAVEGRIQAMARAHSLLATAGWSGADLHRLLLDELLAYTDEERISLSGPAISIRPEATQAVSMLLHELATNAVKHGALSSTAGRVEVIWSPPEIGGTLCLWWQEIGGPAIMGEPEQTGFGIVLLRQVIESQLGGTIEMHWDDPGLACLIILPDATWQGSGVRDAAPLREAAAQPAPILRKPGSTRRRVLVVEDEALTALALQSLLEHAGYTVLGPVGRVEDALDLLRSGPPDAAVLDVNLFGATIDPVAFALEAMGVPFLFCTGYQGGGSAGEHHPRAPVLGKPVNANSLLAAVDSLISPG